MTTALSAAEARRTLYGLIDQINDDCEVVEVRGKRSRVFIVPEDQWRSIEETRYLLTSPANAARLIEGAARYRSGAATVAVSPTELDERIAAKEGPRHRPESAPA